LVPLQLKLNAKERCIKNGLGQCSNVFIIRCAILCSKSIRRQFARILLIHCVMDDQFYYADSVWGSPTYMTEAKGLLLIWDGKLKFYQEIFWPKHQKHGWLWNVLKRSASSQQVKLLFKVLSKDAIVQHLTTPILFDMRQYATLPNGRRLAYHEGISWDISHLQRSYCFKELERHSWIPKVRFVFTGLLLKAGVCYTEELGFKDMGFMADPYSDFGRLAIGANGPCLSIKGGGLGG